MKIVVHSLKQNLFDLTKLCISVEQIDYYSDLEHSDYIYIFNDELTKHEKIKIHFNKLDVNIEVILRRNGYILVCTKENCDCGRPFTTDAIIKDTIFSKDGGLTVKPFRYVTLDRRYDSGFGYYVRDIFRTMFSNFQNESFHVHGCEFESVVAFWGLPNVRLFGLPRVSEEEFILESDELDIAAFSNSKVSLSEVTLRDREMFTISGYQSMSAEESYIKYKVHYPKAYDSKSIELGFKYSTYLSIRDIFKLIFKRGVTMLDLGSGFLYKFLHSDGIKVVVLKGECSRYLVDLQIVEGINVENCICDPEWSSVTEDFDFIDRYYERVSGIANKYVILPEKDYKDKRLIKILKVKTMCLYKYLWGYKRIADRLDVGTREFRATVERKYVERMNMFDDVSEHAIKVALFCYSNERNFRYFKIRKKKNMNLLYGRYYIMLPCAEAYGYWKGRNVNGKRIWINEYRDVKDFTVYNTEIQEFGDYMSVKDFEVLVCPNGYTITSDIFYDITDSKTKYYGIVTNDLKSGIQNVISSPSMNKAISTYIKRNFDLGEDELHRVRFSMFRGLFATSNSSELLFHEPGMWSLAYYKVKDKNVYVDVSGHILNLILACSVSIKNINGYIRMIKLNVGYEMNECGLLEGAVFKKFVNGEDRGSEKTIWHTAPETYAGINIAGMMSKLYDLPNVDIKKVLKRIDQIKYPRGVYSVSVNHDKYEYNFDR